MLCSFLVYSKQFSYTHTDTQTHTHSFFPFFGGEHVGSQFPDQGSNSCPLKWKHGVLTTGPPGNSLYFLFYIFSIMICHMKLNIVPCAIQQDLLFIHSFAKLKLPLHPSSTPPFGNHRLFCMSVCLCFVDKSICVIFQIPHISDIIWCLSFSV